MPYVTASCVKVLRTCVTTWTVYALHKVYVLIRMSRQQRNFMCRHWLPGREETGWNIYCRVNTVTNHLCLCKQWLL